MRTDETRLVDANALVDSLGAEDRDIYCKYTIEDAPTIDAIPVEWLKQQLQKHREIRGKIPLSLEPDIHNTAVMLKCTELTQAISIVLKFYAEWQDGQEEDT